MEGQCVLSLLERMIPTAYNDVTIRRHERRLRSRIDALGTNVERLLEALDPQQAAARVK